MNPPRRKLTAHSLPVTATEKRKKVLDAIEKQKVREFADGWKSLRAFLDH